MKHGIGKTGDSGLTILEILLSMVILAFVLAILGEVGRNSFRNAIAARDTTQAELICESQMGMLRIGLIDLQTQTDLPLDDDYPDTNATSQERHTPKWYYSVEVNSTDEEGMLEVAVTVRQNLKPEQRPVSCRLVRWMIDPEYLEEMEEEMEEILNPETSESTESSTST